MFVYESHVRGKQTPYTEADGFTFPWQQSSHCETTTQGQKANRSHGILVLTTNWQRRHEEGVTREYYFKTVSDIH